MISYFVIKFLLNSAPTTDANAVSPQRQLSLLQISEGSLANEQEVWRDTYLLANRLYVLGYVTSKHNSFIKRWIMADKNESYIKWIIQTSTSNKRSEDDWNRWYL